MVSYNIVERYDETYDIECVKNAEPILVPHEKPKCYKCRLFFICTFILILVICLILTILNLVVKDTNYIDISARAWPHSCGICHKKLLKCSDLKYGCCNISSYGYFGNNQIYLQELNLNFHKIDKGNEEGSNCPSYTELINKYDKYYLKYKNYDNGMNYCNSTDEDCCKLDTIYDNLYRLENYGNNYSEIKDYYDDNKHQYIELNIKGRCPKPYDIVRRYNDGYDDPILAVIEGLFAVLFVLCFWGSLGTCGISKKYTTRRR